MFYIIIIKIINRVMCVITITEYFTKHTIISIDIYTQLTTIKTARDESGNYVFFVNTFVQY